MNNNTEEILILSQWLHEKGFEADMWCCWINSGVPMCPGQLTISPYKKILFPRFGINNIIEAILLPNPFFTLNRALELLPLKLDSRGNPEAPRLLMLSKTAIGYSVASGGYKSASGFHFSGDLHLSALRLLKKTVEENYVKAS